MNTPTPSQAPSAAGPLRDIRVLELGNFIAAPMAGRLLAEFGAEVVKVERPCTGDELRRWRLHGGDTSLLWRIMGRNKKSVTLDLRTEQGQRIATNSSGAATSSWRTSGPALSRSGASDRSACGR